MSQQTLSQAFDATATAEGETLLQCVIGHDEWHWDDRWPAKNTGLITWDQGRPLLAHFWHAGYGGADCPPIYAWSANRVYFVSEYDGSTGIDSMPRNPVECEPGYQ